MRRIVCEKHVKVTRTPDEDALRGLTTRYIRGTLTQAVYCDTCCEPLDVGATAVALSCPADMGTWEDEYFEAAPPAADAPEGQG